jgi:xylitol oxidase
MGARLADGPRHPIPGMSPEHCTEQMGRPGPWHERLPHFRLDHVPSSGDELQSEYIVPRATALDALRSLGSLRHLLAPLLHISEIRTIRADELWLSPAYHRDAVGIHFTWKNDTAAVLAVLAAVERCLADFAPRPHWGKLFTTDPQDVARLYQRSADAVRAMDAADPDGKFRNEMLDQYLPSQHRPRHEETE